MLEKVDLTKKISKEEYKEKMPQLESKLGRLQRECKALGIPVLIVFEGFGAAGKGLQIGHLIQSMDPRGFEVHPVKNETEEERMHPFMWRFWTKTPARGRIAIFDGSWYRKVLIDRFEKRTKAKDLPAAFHSINSFEQQLADDGNLIIKLFLDIDKKEQKKRFDKLAKNKETAWRVSQGDRERNAHYDEYAALMEDMLFNTDTDYAPWTIVESMDRRFATLKIYTTVIKAMADQIEKVQQQNIAKAVEKADKAEAEGVVRKKETNGDEIEEIAREADPVVLGFEGWDAGGKGGAIKRLTAKMDARGYVVNPTASPNDIEKAHHYLWRFWRAMPKDGHVAIFDRTWYGRVMVERIEGFCTTEEWKRAYKEINDMEKDLYNAGAIVIKFWMHIDKDEQERRFKERQENPEKQWKITDEDWRNREKWDQYEDAVNEMLMRTSTDYAPWVVVEGNSKYYARVKVLQTVVDAIEKRLKEE